MNALAYDKKTSTSISNLVLTLLTTNKTPILMDADLITERINNTFGFKLINENIKEAINKLQIDKSVSVKDNFLIINPEKKEEISAFIRSACELETSAKNDWLIEISTFDGYQSAWEQELWQCLRVYVGKALRRYGIRARQILSTQIENGIDEASQTLEGIFSETYNEYASDIPEIFVSKAITNFFLDPTPNQLKYMSELLDGTLTFFALVSNEELKNYFKGEIQPISVYVDTNFIIGLLDLHSYPLNDISKKIISIVKENNLPFTFYVLDQTINEFEITLNKYMEKLIEGKPWSPAKSRSLLVKGLPSSIERQYHEKNSESAIDPEIFFGKYKNVRELLKQYKFIIVSSEIIETDQTRADFNKLCERYHLHLETHFPDRFPKRQESIAHDMILLREARNKRAKGLRIFESGSMCLTIDSTLYSFDWYDDAYGDNPTGVAIFPGQLLHMLMPFTSMTQNYQKCFIETFALPEFRVIVTDYKRVKDLVNDYFQHYKKEEPEVANRILSDIYLTTRIKEYSEEENNFDDLIEQAITKDYYKLHIENKKLHETLQQVQQELEKIKHELQDEQHKFELKMKKFLSICLAISVFIISIFIIWFLPSIINWNWLITHSHTLSIRICSTLISLCGSSLFLVKKKKIRNYIIASFLIPSFFLILKVLDP